MAIFLILLTVFFWGIAPILDKTALKNGDPFFGTLIRGMTIGIIMLIVTLIAGKIKPVFSMPHKAILLFSISGLLAGGLGVFTYYKALQISHTSQIVPLASIYPLITVLLSIWLLKEPFSIQRIIGTIFIIAGVLLVK